MTSNKNILKIYYYLLFSHLIIWTLIPSFSNVNLPLDTIETLAWGSNLDWGFNKHPPLSAFVIEFFFQIFGSNDWAYYFLSQIFVVTAFIFVWKLSNEIFEKKMYALISLLILEGIFFFNFTTPEFNVNVSQLPFWALSVYFFWKGINSKKLSFWIFFGICSALGFLSKYLFIYILFSLFLYIIFYFRNSQKILFNYFISVLISLVILIPHFAWLFNNDFITVTYGLDRSSVSDSSVLDHLSNPINLILKQLLVLTPFFLMVFVIVKNFKFKISLKNRKISYLFFISILPLFLMLLTSFLTGAKIRTMWMTPFYLFLGTFVISILRKNIDFKKLKRFYLIFLFFFIISPSVYLGVSLLDNTKRTDYPGKEISRLVQNKWDDNFVNDIKIVIGDEWFAGNLSYHLSSRPTWVNDLKSKVTEIQEDDGVVYTGNPKILKEICPGVFGTIKPVGYCMIGKR